MRHTTIPLNCPFIRCSPHSIKIIINTSHCSAPFCGGGADVRGE